MPFIITKQVIVYSMEIYQIYAGVGCIQIAHTRPFTSFRLFASRAKNHCSQHTKSKLANILDFNPRFKKFLLNNS